MKSIDGLSRGQGTRIKIVEIDVGYKPIVEQHFFERVRKNNQPSTVQCFRKKQHVPKQPRKISPLFTRNECARVCQLLFHHKPHTSPCGDRKHELQIAGVEEACAATRSVGFSSNRVCQVQRHVNDFCGRVAMGGQMESVCAACRYHRGGLGASSVVPPYQLQRGRRVVGDDNRAGLCWYK